MTSSTRSSQSSSHSTDARSRRRFELAQRAHSVLALDPQAVDFSYLYAGARANERTDDGIAIVTVTGPLEHHATEWWDSYESIVERVEAAMGGGDDAEALAPARAVILKVDSPGGEAAGTMWAHRKLRSLRKQYDVPLYAYANEMIASAAYAISSAADEIWLPDTGTVGSIGVIATLFDRTEQNAQSGLSIELITSGAYKADNHADRVIDDGIRERMQTRVDALATVFFDIVARARTRALGEKVTVDAVSSLEAGVFIGSSAVDAGIADGVANWDRFLRIVSASLDAPDSLTASDSAA